MHFPVQVVVFFQQFCAPAPFGTGAGHPPGHTGGSFLVCGEAQTMELLKLLLLLLLLLLVVVATGAGAGTREGAALVVLGVLLVVPLLLTTKRVALLTIP